MFKKDRWQLVSNDSVWMFPPDIQLSTVELERHELLGLNDYSHESCLFFANGDSDVVKSYYSQAEAEKGHVEWEEKYGLKRVQSKNLRINV
jgi:hypothetical protein